MCELNDNAGHVRLWQYLAAQRIIDIYGVETIDGRTHAISGARFARRSAAMAMMLISAQHRTPIACFIDYKN